ncbi:MAG: hypothetical protein JJU02_04750 [Cryomorphaceae bacterium]|nr:hypothetical protein [Cryomorphaceae bacterium]
MIETYHRNINQQELQELTSRKPSMWTKIERFSMKLIAITMILLIPFLIIDKFFPVPSQTEGIIVIVLFTISIAMSIYWTKRDPIIAFEKQRKENNEIEIIRCSTNRAIKREDPEDFGVSFYLDTEDGRTLYLQGQYLDILEYDKQFPNSEFELIRTKNTKELIDFKVKGNYFEPEKTLQAFTMEDFKKGFVPEDGEILDIEFEKIK